MPGSRAKTNVTNLTNVTNVTNVTKVTNVAKVKKVPELCTRFHRASELIGRRWTGAIVFVLLRQRCRFATLRAAIPDITDRMLSDRLQELEGEGIVERTVVP